jgi:hypothetical protein
MQAMETAPAFNHMKWGKSHLKLNLFLYIYFLHIIYRIHYTVHLYNLILVVATSHNYIQWINSSFIFLLYNIQRDQFTYILNTYNFVSLEMCVNLYLAGSTMYIKTFKSFHSRLIAENLACLSMDLIYLFFFFKFYSHFIHKFN